MIRNLLENLRLEHNLMNKCEESLPKILGTLLKLKKRAARKYEPQNERIDVDAHDLTPKRGC